MPARQNTVEQVLKWSTEGNPQSVVAQVEQVAAGIRKAVAQMNADLQRAGIGTMGTSAAGGGSGNGSGSSKPPNHSSLPPIGGGSSGGGGGGGHGTPANLRGNPHLSRLFNRAPGQLGRAGAVAGNLSAGFDMLGLGGMGGGAGMAAQRLYGLSYMTQGMSMLSSAAGGVALGLGLAGAAVVTVGVAMKKSADMAREYTDAIRKMAESTGLDLSTSARVVGQFAGTFGVGGAGAALGGIAGSQARGARDVSSMGTQMAAAREAAGAAAGSYYRPNLQGLAAFGVSQYNQGSTLSNPSFRPQDQVLMQLGKELASRKGEQQAVLRAAIEQELPGALDAANRIARDYTRGRKAGQGDDQIEAGIRARGAGTGETLAGQLGSNQDAMDRLDVATQRINLDLETMGAEIGGPVINALGGFAEHTADALDRILRIGHGIGDLFGWLKHLIDGLLGAGAAAAGMTTLLNGLLTSLPGVSQVKALGDLFNAITGGMGQAAGPTKNMTTNLGAFQSSWKAADLPGSASSAKSWGDLTAGAFERAGVAKDGFLANLELLKNRLTPDYALHLVPELGEIVVPALSVLLMPSLAPVVVPDLVQRLLPELAPFSAPDTAVTLLPNLGPLTVPDYVANLIPALGAFIVPDSIANLIPVLGPIVVPALTIAAHLDFGALRQDVQEWLLNATALPRSILAGLVAQANGTATPQAGAVAVPGASAVAVGTATGQGWGAPPTSWPGGAQASQQQQQAAATQQQEAAKGQQAAQNDAVRAAEQQLQSALTDLDSANQFLQSTEVAAAASDQDTQTAWLQSRTALQDAQSAAQNAYNAVVESEAAPEQQQAALTQAAAALAQVQSAAQQVQSGQLLSLAAGLYSTSTDLNGAFVAQFGGDVTKHGASVSSFTDSIGKLVGIDWTVIGTQIAAAVAVHMPGAPSGGGSAPPPGGGSSGGGNNGNNNGSHTVSTTGSPGTGGTAQVINGGPSGGNFDWGAYNADPNNQGRARNPDGTVRTAARGAIARATPGGQVVHAAEAGYDEAFIPLNDYGASFMRSALGLDDGGGGGGSIVGGSGRSGRDVTINNYFNVSGADFSSRDFLDRLTRAVSDTILGNLQMLGSGRVA